MASPSNITSQRQQSTPINVGRKSEAPSGNGKSCKRLPAMKVKQRLPVMQETSQCGVFLPHQKIKEVTFGGRRLQLFHPT